MVTLKVFRRGSLRLARSVKAMPSAGSSACLTGSGGRSHRQARADRRSSAGPSAPGLSSRPAHLVGGAADASGEGGAALFTCVADE